MGCTSTGYKTFLICCNFALLFVGGSVLILGLKMKWALSLLFLTNIPVIAKAIEAVIATGFFISLAGLTGISGACYECTWLLIMVFSPEFIKQYWIPVRFPHFDKEPFTSFMQESILSERRYVWSSIHLTALGVIVIMEFSLGVTLMFVKNTVQSTIEKSDCSNFCATTLDAMVLDYALPSAGLMMTIIVLEALMIYSAIRLYFHIRDAPKTTAVAGPNIVVQNVQMQNVAAPQADANYVISRPLYFPQMEYMAPQPLHAPNPAPTQYITAGPEFTNPPEYISLPPEQQEQQQLPPTYNEAAPIAEASAKIENTDKTTNENKESNNPV